jgi:hypothetical protein
MKSRKAFVLEDPADNPKLSHGGVSIIFWARTPRAAALKAARRGHYFIRLRECLRETRKGCRVHVFKAVNIIKEDGPRGFVQEKNVRKIRVDHRRIWGLVDLEAEKVLPRGVMVRHYNPSGKEEKTLVDKVVDRRRQTCRQEEQYTGICRQTVDKQEIHKITLKNQ